MTPTFTPAELDAMGYTVVDGKAVRAVAATTEPTPTKPNRAAMPASRPANWREKDEQRECWRTLLACGFKVWWLSQARRTGQTRGIPDLLARHQEKRIVLWVEVKNPDDPAEWTTEQQDFCRSCIEEKETYMIGGEGKLRAWLSTQGWDL